MSGQQVENDLLRVRVARLEDDMIKLQKELQQLRDDFESRMEEHLDECVHVERPAEVET
jgi:chaperonin cofactor prefoldin